jgi:tRNA-Thr(GGU) m(6)t(6)A37 methyltransferase TsaA
VKDTLKTPLTPGDIVMSPIGICHTDFDEKFGIPRQPGLCEDARGVVILNESAELTRACRELSQFSHIWLIFCFHVTGRVGWRPTIRPPRLGGKKRVGVLSTRSPHRPNPIGISAVGLERIETTKNRTALYVYGVDLVDRTPILDVKPYIGYADAIGEASTGWAVGGFTITPVAWTYEAEKSVTDLLQNTPPIITSLNDLTEERARRIRLISQVISHDPRPAAQKERYPVTAALSSDAVFGITLFGWDVQFRIEEQRFVVFSITPFIKTRSFYSSFQKSLPK